MKFRLFKDTTLFANQNLTRQFDTTAKVFEGWDWIVTPVGVELRTPTDSIYMIPLPNIEWICYEPEDNYEWGFVAPGVPEAPGLGTEPASTDLGGQPGQFGVSTEASGGAQTQPNAPAAGLPDGSVKEESSDLHQKVGKNFRMPPPLRRGRPRK